MSLQKLKEKALKNDAVRAEYDQLAEEIELIDKLITMRSQAGLTQEALANRLGTNKSNISRMERGRGNPSWTALNKYAGACGFRIKLETVPEEPADKANA
ncbi:MAG: XRE family transcriptional regulator [Halomonadaceae bacterium]|nr:MAG: XRE family transcriptional regulator [Halomonadaceae bacterium]